MKVIDECANVLEASMGPAEAPPDNDDPASVSTIVTVSVRVRILDGPRQLAKLLAAAGLAVD